MTVLVSSSSFSPRVNSYSGLLTELTRLIDGEDTSVSDIAADTLRQIVNLGERKIYREVRSRHNEKTFEGVIVSSNLAPIPEDFESCSIVHFGGLPLKPVSEEALRAYLDTNPTGDAVMFCEAGANFLFGPSVTDGTELQGRYYARLADLSESTLPSNQLFRNEYDLFVYAALSEAAGLFGRETDAKVPMWEAKYRDLVARINRNKQRAAYSAGRMQRSTSTTLMG